MAGTVTLLVRQTSRRPLVYDLRLGGIGWGSLGGERLKITFYGVRGSTPCDSGDVARYGGNTSSVVLEAPGEQPLLLDLGTGVRYFGKTQPLDGSFHGN